MTLIVISRNHLGLNGKPGLNGAAGANGSFLHPGAAGGAGQIGTAGVSSLVLHSGSFIISHGVFTGGAGGNGGSGGKGGNGSSGGSGGAAGAGAPGGAALEVSSGSVVVTGGSFIGGSGGRGGSGGATAAPGYSFLMTGGTLTLKGVFTKMPPTPITTGTGTIIGTVTGNRNEAAYTYNIAYGRLVLINAPPK